MFYKVELWSYRTENEIDDLLDKLAEQESQGGSKFPGMTYEDGIKAMLEWLTDKNCEAILD